MDPHPKRRATGHAACSSPPEREGPSSSCSGAQSSGHGPTSAAVDEQGVDLCLAGVLQWPAAMLDATKAYDDEHSTALCQEMGRVCAEGFVLTSAYTGLGAAETTCALIVEEAVKRGLLSVRSDGSSSAMVVHAACDVFPSPLLEQAVKLAEAKAESA